jgi:two-component system response regulator AtoC
MLSQAEATVLVADDERNLREGLAELFAAEGWRVLQAGNGEEVTALLADQEALPEVIFLDLKMPRRDGIATLRALKGEPRLSRIPVVIITALGGSEETIEAMKAGAYDYITKPFEADEVIQTARRAIEVSRLWHEVERLRDSAGAVGEAASSGIVGRHPAMREIFKLIGKVAPSQAPVLIVGESGTGKELIAQAIHRHSTRFGGPMVTVNCGAIPEALTESELFGYERGAFTGAVSSKPGRLENADGGTLFLDEIGDLPPGVQVKLLRALQERRFERLGGKGPISADFRLIAATNQDLARLAAEGRFREDLFYRLNVVRIDVPPLRVRRSDIAELAEYFLSAARMVRADAPSGFSEEAMRALIVYDYPGNVRELRNIVERAVALAQGPLIAVADLPPLAASGREARAGLETLLEMPLEEAVSALERAMIERALQRSAGNKAEAARILGIHRQLLYAKLKELGIE